MDATVWKGGDTQLGFRIVQDRKQRLVRLELWGLWSDALGEEFRTACTAAFRAIHSGESWAVLADISRYPPQRPTVQQVHADMMELSVKLGITRAANLVSSALSRLQIKRLSEESGLPLFSFFSSEPEALKWLLER